MVDFHNSFGVIIKSEFDVVSRDYFYC